MDFIWRYIDIDPTEVAVIRAEYQRALPRNDLFYQKVSINLDSFLNRKLAQSVLIQVAPQTGLNCENIHRDYMYYPDCLAINIPLENCDSSVTKFWRTSQKPQLVRTPNGHTYSYYAAQDCEFVTEFCLNQPVLFNTSQLHNVVNPTDQWRLAISLRFQENPIDLIDC